MANIKRLAGSSAGAITAGLLACNHSSDELLRILEKKNFNDFKDESFGAIRDIKRLKKKYGFYAGKEFHSWYGNLLQAKTDNRDITFAQIKSQYGKDLLVTGTCLNRRETHYYTETRNADMPIRDAVRISMSLPLFFAAVDWKGDILVDGGVLNNYPVWIFDGDFPGDPNGPSAASNPRTLGLKLLTDQEVQETISGQHISKQIKTSRILPSRWRIASGRKLNDCTLSRKIGSAPLPLIPKRSKPHSLIYRRMIKACCLKKGGKVQKNFSPGMTTRKDRKLLASQRQGEVDFGYYFLSR